MSYSRRILGRKINGILLLNKPIGMTSNAALQRVKRLYSAKKAGHSGSLDPLATGMLPVCFGEATKFAQYILDADKRYDVIAQLGIKTTTADAEGEIIEQRPVGVISSAQLESVLSNFRGTISQTPSMFSAIKHQGQPLYKLARQGIEIERVPRTVQIFALDLIEQRADQLVLRVHCSKGTYIRNLVEDIGEQLGCGAHVIQLHRSRVGAYPADQMVDLAALEAEHVHASASALDHHLLPVDTLLQECSSLYLAQASAFYLRTGQAVLVPNAPTEGLVKLYSERNEFLGIGEVLDDGRIAPRKLLSVAEH